MFTTLLKDFFPGNHPIIVVFSFKKLVRGKLKKEMIWDHSYAGTRG